MRLCMADEEMPGPEIMRMKDGRELAVWTRKLVEERLRDAATTLQRLSTRRSSARLSRWPKLIERFVAIQEAEQPHKFQLRPTPREISRMEEALPWFYLVGEQKRRVILFARALGVSSRMLAEGFSISRECVRLWHRDSLEEVTRRLNEMR